MSEANGQAGRAYIGSFTSAEGRGIITAALDPRTGALTEVHHTGTLVRDPSALTLAAPGGPLYAVSERDPGAVAALSLADPDRPELLDGPTPVPGAGPTHLTLAAGRLFTADYGSGSVSSLPVRADGTLGDPAAVHRHTGGGPEPGRQETPHAHAVVADPSGRWLLSADLGTDSVWVYDLRQGPPADGPRTHTEVALRTGSGPRQLVFHPGGGHVYVVNELDSSLTVCGWDADDGTLEPLRRVATVPDPAHPERNYPSELAVSRDGRFAWAANRGHDSISVFDVAASGDSLELTGTVRCGGRWPRALALHPSQRWLYAANERSGDVSWFTVDQITGTPHLAGSLPAPAASSVVFG